MQKKSIGLLVLGIAIGVAVFLGLLNRGVAGGYAYTCADGTEFSITPSTDYTSITVYPTKNAALFPEKKLPKVESNTGALYVAGGVVFAGKGEGVQLITAATSTTCKPLQKKDEPPINWGD
ncbi:hypothetical protein EXS62_02190 [Candidatus Kaiserbacteria bacterium]|nr:hypothetical protein [Candidatus Kaiserbacteria bacterium]